MADALVWFRRGPVISLFAVFLILIANSFRTTPVHRALVSAARFTLSARENCVCGQPDVAPGQLGSARVYPISQPPTVTARSLTAWIRSSGADTLSAPQACQGWVEGSTLFARSSFL